MSAPLKEVQFLHSTQTRWLPPHSALPIFAVACTWRHFFSITFCYFMSGAYLTTRELFSASWGITSGALFFLVTAAYRIKYVSHSELASRRHSSRGWVRTNWPCFLAVLLKTCVCMRSKETFTRFSGPTSRTSLFLPLLKGEGFLYRLSIIAYFGVANVSREPWDSAWNAALVGVWFTWVHWRNWRRNPKYVAIQFCPRCYCRSEQISKSFGVLHRILHT